MSGQRRHESPEVGDAIVRMMRGLVARAGEGDTEALEQLARIEDLAPIATGLGVRFGHSFGHSFTELGDALGVSRQAARMRVHSGAPADYLDDEAHQLIPGHSKRECEVC